MAVIFIEGFDKYGVPNTNQQTVSPNVSELLAQGDWTSSTGSFTQIIAGLSATGGAIQFVTSAFVSRTLPANYPRLIGGVRFNGNLNGAHYIQLLDGGSPQCTIMINATGLISLRNGQTNGTLLATSSATVAANTTHYLEWDITFSNTGSYQVWLDGASIFAGTGDLTATANNYANVISLNTPASTTVAWDDLYLFDATGSRNNAVLLTSPRVETTFPISNSAVQFGFGAATLGGSLMRAATSYNPGANHWYVRPITPTQNCTLVSLTTLGSSSSNGAMNLRPIVYSSSAGVPGTLLTSGPTVTGMFASTLKLMTLTTPQSLTAGTQYWIGFMCDVTGGGNIFAVGDTLLQGRSGTSTFASGAPSTPPTNSAGISTVNIWGNITGSLTNTYCVGGGAQGQPSMGVPITGQMYVTDSVVGHEDLYNFSALSSLPINIYTVAVKAYVAKSDLGARTISIRTKSGSTDSSGTGGNNQTLSSSFMWQFSYYDLDPNGNVAWTPATLNAATSGVMIDT